MREQMPKSITLNKVRWQLKTKTFYLRKTLFLAIIMLVLMALVNLNQTVQASHGSTYHNAVEGKAVSNSGAWASITWTNPSLNGGLWSAARVASSKRSPYRFIEHGWFKSSDFTTIRGVVSHTTANGTITSQTYTNITAGTHTYKLQYHPGTNKFWCYLENQAVYNVHPGFTQGDDVQAGGEVATGVEGMGNIYFSDLRYISSPGTGYRLWNGHSTYLADSPYFTSSAGQNAFFACRTPDSCR